MHLYSAILQDFAFVSILAGNVFLDQRYRLYFRKRNYKDLNLLAYPGVKTLLYIITRTIIIITFQIKHRGNIAPTQPPRTTIQIPAPIPFPSAPFWNGSTLLVPSLFSPLREGDGEGACASPSRLPDAVDEMLVFGSVSEFEVVVVLPLGGWDAAFACAAAVPVV